jgi:hypothetical protein
MENSNYSDWEQATLDAEGYAVCPDCGYASDRGPQWMLVWGGGGS